MFVLYIYFSYLTAVATCGGFAAERGQEISIDSGVRQVPSSNGAAARDRGRGRTSLLLSRASRTPVTPLVDFYHHCRQLATPLSGACGRTSVSSAATQTCWRCWTGAARAELAVMWMSSNPTSTTFARATSSSRATYNPTTSASQVPSPPGPRAVIMVTADELNWTELTWTSWPSYTTRYWSASRSWLTAVQSRTAVQFGSSAVNTRLRCWTCDR